jgi:hypothetical protein
MSFLFCGGFFCVRFPSGNRPFRKESQEILPPGDGQLGEAYLVRTQTGQSFGEKRTHRVLILTWQAPRLVEWVLYVEQNMSPRQQPTLASLRVGSGRDSTHPQVWRLLHLRNFFVDIAHDLSYIPVASKMLTGGIVGYLL